MLVETLEGVDRLERRPQDHGQATYAPKLRKEDGHLDWSREASDIDRRVRAFTPWPSAFTGFRGRRLIVLGGRMGSEDSGGMPAGAILSRGREGLEVACGRGTYIVERLQPENKGPMSAYDFSLGARIKEGERLEAYSSKM
ncbi:MAG: hypothetical protein FJY83_09860 [Candidatus Aminicenantes bacterium]|nr:hypothetical protein [Candidatus Aminicenantes bacterium]